MAHSNSFFGLRKGSTKSLTFQVLDGKQITKDRVAGGKNPQTSVQMSQRLCFATVAAAFSTMREICNHSFENADGKNRNQSEFVRRNIALMRNKSGNFNPNTWKYMIPNNYIVADGSLSLGINCGLSSETEQIGTKFYCFFDVLGLDAILSKTKEELLAVTWQEFADVVGLDAGDQLTYMSVITNGEEVYAIGDLESNSLHLCRLVVPTSAEDLAKPVFQAVEGSSGYYSVINAGETSQGLDKFVVYADKSRFGLQSPDDYGTAALCYGAALIRSAYDGSKWKRSKAVLAFDSEVVNEKELTISQVLPTWNPKGDMYLNNAAKSVPAAWLKV